MKLVKLGSPFLLPVLLAAGTACSISEEKAVAEAAVAQFHAQLDASQFQEIYADADELFKKSTSETDAVALFEAVHRKLGPVKESRQLNYFVNYDLATGKQIRLTYETEFAEGKGTEQFVWRVADGRARLLGYHINAAALILK